MSGATDGYGVEADGSLVHYVRGVPQDRLPPDGTLAFLVEEFDHWHDRVHRHGAPGFVEGQRHSMLRRVRGILPAGLKVVEVEVSSLDGGTVEAINAHMLGKGEGLLRDKLAGLATHYPRP